MTPRMNAYNVKTGALVRNGDTIYSRGESARLIAVTRNAGESNPGSSGRVYVEWLDGTRKGWKYEYFPHVFGLVLR